MLRQPQKALPVCLPQFLYGHLVRVMPAFGILLAPFPQLLVEFLEECDGKDRHKGIPPGISYLVFHVPFLICNVFILPETAVSPYKGDTMLVHCVEASIFLCFRK